MNLVNIGEKGVSVADCDDLCAQVADEVEALLAGGGEGLCLVWRREVRPCLCMRN